MKDLPKTKKNDSQSQRDISLDGFSDGLTSLYSESESLKVFNVSKKKHSTTNKGDILIKAI